MPHSKGVRLLARRPDGIFVVRFEQGEIRPDLFRAACRMGLEGLVSKRRDRPYQAGRSKRWVKVKNRKHPAMSRVMDTRVIINETPRCDLRACSIAFDLRLRLDSAGCFVEGADHEMQNRISISGKG